MDLAWDLRISEKFTKYVPGNDFIFIVKQDSSGFANFSKIEIFIH